MDTETLPSLGCLSYYDRQGRPMGEWEGMVLAVEWPPGYRRIRESWVRDYLVSTIWLGFDHSFGSSPIPVIFETMVFGPNNYSRQWRYCTEAEAVQGHYTVLYGLLTLLHAPVSEVRGWLELTGWNRRRALT